MQSCHVFSLLKSAGSSGQRTLPPVTQPILPPASLLPGLSDPGPVNSGLQPGPRKCNLACAVPHLRHIHAGQPVSQPMPDHLEMSFLISPVELWPLTAFLSIRSEHDSPNFFFDRLSGKPGCSMRAGTM